MRSVGICFFLALKNFSTYSINPKPISLKPIQDKRVRQLVSGVPCRGADLDLRALKCARKLLFISVRNF
jgi:hypothetical protein